jgi:hypothetical protein
LTGESACATLANFLLQFFKKASNLRRAAQMELSVALPRRSHANRYSARQHPKGWFVGIIVAGIDW